MLGASGMADPNLRNNDHLDLNLSDISKYYSKPNEILK